ncbi:hypothetical protein BT1A1_1953 [Caldibacillus thermoamylovorans]|uniref:MIP18 family-like domain-containing protein n=1 Tax=Caldibacillus thermoamylovorans TaxID=35841 RepID=A0A090J1P0_9BACI|nr:iron-sulfur cluster assembly protein [Caldibacillus thermoamylovorans]CEE01775.1 hypothetical protein BT1A1_1953 [Caldibacillus thermoamylovorans]
MNVKDRIYEELKYVFDPEIGVNIVDLGLVYDVDVTEDGIARISLTFTTDDIKQQERLCAGVKFAVSSLGVMKDVEIIKKETVKWTTQMMNEELKKDLIGIN